GGAGAAARARARLLNRHPTVHPVETELKRRLRTFLRVHRNSAGPSALAPVASEGSNVLSRRRTKIAAGVGIAAAVVAVLANPAWAQEVDPVAEVQANLDNIFILVAAILVIFMQAGFAFVEAGLTRGKNVANIMMKNMMDFAVGVIDFAAVGFSFAFGSGNDFIGTSGWFIGNDIAENYLGESTISLSTFFIFQVAFAATAATIV